MTLALPHRQGIQRAWGCVFLLRRMRSSGILAWASLGVVLLWMPVQASWPSRPVSLLLQALAVVWVAPVLVPDGGGWLEGVATLEHASQLVCLGLQARGVELEDLLLVRGP